MTETPETFPPLSPDTPILEVISAVARQIKAQTGKPASFVAVPRVLALSVAGDRGAQTKAVLLPEQIEGLLDAHIDPVLLAIPVEEGGKAIPIIAMDMPTPMVAAWNWPVPRFAENEGFEEHPDYPALPFSRKLWDDHQPERIPEMCGKLLKWCHSHAQKHPSPAFQIVYSQASQARPLVRNGEQKSETLPLDPELMWGMLDAGLTEQSEQIKKAMQKHGFYGMEFDAMLPEDVWTKLQTAAGERFNAFAEVMDHPAKPGWKVVALTPMKVLE